MALAPTLAVVGIKSVAAVLLGRTTWRTSRADDHPSATPFVALLATLTLWAAFSLGAELPSLTPDELVATVCSFGQFGAALLVPGLWVVYALGYTGRGTGLTRARVALFAGIGLPVLLGGIVVYTESSRAAIRRGVAPLIALEVLYLFVLFVYGTYLLVRFGGDHPRVSNAQVAVVTGGVAAPYLVSAVRDSAEVVGGTSLGLLLAGGLLAVAVRRYPVTTGFPRADHVARTRVVESLREAVLVLDRDDHVLDANETATRLLETPADGVVGDPVGAVVDGLAGVDLAAGATGQVSLPTSKGRRRFEYGVSAVDDPSTDGDDPLARTVLLRDVTDRRTRQQRLSVLDRSLRHNVRNNLDAVLAYVDLIDDEEVRDRIRDGVTDTLRLSDKAREAEEVMTAVTEPPDVVDVAAVAAAAADEFRSAEYPGEVSVARPDAPRVVTHRSVVRRVLSELIENALVHSDPDPDPDGEPPRVEVTVRAGTDAAAEVVIADNGPGLPEHEREILTAGAETQLHHSRGIGLWFVRWAVTRLGGDLEFDRNEPTGTVVTVRLHDAAA